MVFTWLLWHLRIFYYPWTALGCNLVKLRLHVKYVVSSVPQSHSESRNKTIFWELLLKGHFEIRIGSFIGLFLLPSIDTGTIAVMLVSLIMTVEALE